ncbi:hypothetical protein [Lacinutrix sp. 5H-3-7-4]|uniref:hypothetical protein n=1 Tax=Lacinutrix sp. (strain 5H-3-7-4) TaxID=983544 RepID=UPI00020A3604|nr:hypothetical protein [Lacinutrix sp. 5H-3-7-4]AEH02245.1 hypothetical protein Lacal_2403 [Lacinutrix sp. 5H-3-7-4]
MKKTLLLLIIFFSLFLNYSCQQPERNCTNYKTGVFTFNYTDAGVEKQGKIIRNDTLQIEEFDGKVQKSKIRWINDCEVIFKTINPKRMVDKNDIHLKILTTTDSSYTFEYSYVGKSIKQKGTAYKLKK